MSLLQRLRLQVYFPGKESGLSFEALPEIDSYIASLKFDGFYPLETGPLPVFKTSRLGGTLAESPDYPIYIPNDQEQLRTIQGRFILLPDQSKHEFGFDEEAANESVK